jgi:hypothetical protein
MYNSTFTSTTDINDTLLPTITIEGTLTSAAVMNDTLLPTVTIDGTFTSTPVINDTIDDWGRGKCTVCC